MGPSVFGVLRNVELSVEDGTFVALMGPSGSGKTTLLNLIGGLDTPTSGEIEVDGLRLDSVGARCLARWRAQSVGFVFQFYNLLPVLTAERNVELPLLLTGLSRSERRKNAALALDIVGLGDRGRHKPGELSGGQQQRVAIARALVSDPRLLVCDEPTGDLDRETADEILELLQTLHRELGKDHSNGDSRSQGGRPCDAYAAHGQGQAGLARQDGRPGATTSGGRWREAAVAVGRGTCSESRRERHSRSYPWPSRSCCSCSYRPFPTPFPAGCPWRAWTGSSLIPSTP